eukprot:scaffold20329_cov73-Cylindrotheca_fusiformis.AAC.1
MGVQEEQDWRSRSKVKIGEATSKIVTIDEATLKTMKIGEATSKKQHILADRQRCRIMSAAGVVIPHVLPFLGSN